MNFILISYLFFLKIIFFCIVLMFSLIFIILNLEFVIFCFWCLYFYLILRFLFFGEVRLFIGRYENKLNGK